MKRLTEFTAIAMLFAALCYSDFAAARFLSPDPVSVGDKIILRAIPRPGARPDSVPNPLLPVRDQAALYGIAALANAHTVQPPLELNPYAYTVNNPLRWTDPDGKNTVAIGGGIGFSLGGPPGAVIGAIIGGGVGVGIYYLCKSESEEDRCKKVKNECIDACSKFGLPSSDGTGASFHRCVRACMERQNCFNY